MNDNQENGFPSRDRQGAEACPRDKKPLPHGRGSEKRSFRMAAQRLKRQSMMGSLRAVRESTSSLSMTA